MQTFTLGLLCAPDGCPAAIEVFDGNLDHVVLVGDRGMITQARITKDIKSAGLDWITSLRDPAIKALVESDALQLAWRQCCSTTPIRKRPRLCVAASQRRGSGAALTNSCRQADHPPDRGRAAGA